MKGNREWLRFYSSLSTDVFHTTLTTQKSIELFGEQGSKQIALVGAFHGYSIVDIKHKSIDCNGKITGTHTISDLIERGFLTNGGIIQLPTEKLTTIRISQAMPELVVSGIQK
ncbi:unnamed protein product [Rhizopus stolonifer]